MRVDLIGNHCKNRLDLAACVRTQASSSLFFHRIEKFVEMTGFRLRFAWLPALVIKATDQHRQLGAEVHGILGPNPVPESVKRGSEKLVGVMPVRSRNAR